MKRFLVYILITASFITSSLGQTPNFQVNEKYRKAPFLIAKSPKKLANYLTKNDSSQAQKALNIYTWITYNIKYDFKALAKKKSKTFSTKQTLRRKKGICYQYSNLFTTLCKNSGISAKEIVGYSKGLLHSEGDTFYETDHSWNGIKIDSSWYLVDATWGSGIPIQRTKIFKKLWFKWFNRPYINDLYKFQRKPNLGYFLIAPEKLIKDHLPSDPSWQLINFPISVSTFENDNWNGYKHVMDSSYSKKIDSSSYILALNQYQSISNREYLTRTATKSNIFNPKNYKLLGYASFVNAHFIANGFGTPKSIMEHKKKSIRYYKTAIQNSKKHQKIVASETTKTIRQTKNHIKSELVVPSKLRIRSNKRILSSNKKALAKRKKYIEGYSKQRSNLLKISTKKKYKKLLVKKYAIPENIAENKLKIERTLNLIKVAIDSVKKLRTGLESFILLKNNLHSKIKSQNTALETFIKLSRNVILQNGQFRKISSAIHQSDSVGSLIDTLFIKLTHIEKDISLCVKSIREHQVSIITQSLNVQKLLTENCQFSKGVDCNNDIYQNLNILRKQVYRNKLNMLETLQKMRRIDFQFYKSLNHILENQLQFLDINMGFISFYQKIQIKKTVLKKNRSNHDTNRIINESNARIKTLSKDIIKLKQSFKKKKH